MGVCGHEHSGGRVEKDVADALNLKVLIEAEDKGGVETRTGTVGRARGI